MGIILLAQERLAEPTPVEELIPLEELASAAASVSAGSRAPAQGARRSAHLEGNA